RVGSLRVDTLVASLRRLDYALVFSRRVWLVLIAWWVLTLRNGLLLYLDGIGRSPEGLITVSHHKRECRHHDSGYVEPLHGTKPLPGTRSYFTASRHTYSATSH